ncbi:hypothetical protein D477_020318, partial [Arthrobacter crystallopoietes BAB-32]
MGQAQERDPEGQLGRAEVLAARLDRPMGVLGVLFVLIVLAQLLATHPTLVAVLSVIGWLFWAVFVAEFLLRAYIARFRWRFWKRNWWQVVFLLVPFLRFFRSLQALRVLRATRVSRLGSVLSAGIRGSRSAGRLLSSRIGWLAAVTAVVILVSSQLLYVAGSYERYSAALLDAAMSTITGAELSASDGFALFLQVLLAVYSVAVFATLAGAVGAFFLRGGQAEPAAAGNEADPAASAGTAGS